MRFNGYYCDETMSERVYNWIRALEKENKELQDRLNRIEAPATAPEVRAVREANPEIGMHDAKKVAIALRAAERGEK